MQCVGPVHRASRNPFEKDFHMFARTVTALIAATALTMSFSTASLAADSATAVSGTVPAAASAPASLAPGHAAGLHQAQIFQPNQTLLWVGGIVVLGVGIGLLVSNNNGHSSSTTGTH
jgi:hypothetical protein